MNSSATFLSKKTTVIAYNILFSQLIHSFNFKMKAAVVLSSLAALANAAAVKRASPLQVKIEQVNNSEVKASITNTGSTSLKVLKAGSILDNSPIEKAQISTTSVNGGEYQEISPGKPPQNS